MHIVDPALAEKLLATYGYVAIFALMMLESAGIPLPGETILVSASVYARLGVRVDSKWRCTMSEQWQYQLRVYLNDDMADVARSDRNNPALQPLTNILNKHHAALMSQFDAFENYVAEAEKEGPENFPLYKWTKATIEDPAKREKHIKTFALHVSGNEVYTKEVADALEADLQSLVGGALVTRMSKHDTNPANNLQVPPLYRS